MSSLSSNLKQWGSTGSEYPNGYNYLEGEQPVDEWDNYLTYHTVKEIQALQSVVNDRMESDVTGGGSHPSTPEVGHISHRTDTSNLPTTDEATFVYDNTNSVWHRLMKADGDTMTGELDMGGYRLKDATGTLSLDGPVEASDARLDSEWFSKQEGGTVSAGNIVPIGTFGLDAGESLQVTQAILTRDGFTEPCVSGVNLVIRAAESATTTTILSGDGATLYDDETGRPHTSYTNNTGSHETVIIGIDNGQFTTGYGSDVMAFGGYIARTV